MPFAGYKDFADCVKKNSDKDDPKAYCGRIQADVENKPKGERGGDRGGEHDRPLYGCVPEDKRKAHGTEPVGDGTMTDIDTKGTRMLNTPMGDVADDRLVARGDGGLVIKEIIALAAGTWTDSNVRKPLAYTDEVLEKDSKNWVGNGIWSRHMGGSPRDITAKIGEIQNPRYSTEHHATVVDGYLHGRTQASRDVIALVKAGLVTDVSVEHGGTEVWNADAKRNEAASLAFYGLAIVDKGACEVCKLKHNGACETTEDKEMADGEGEPVAAAPSAEEAQKESEVELLKQRIADLEAELARLKAEKAVEEAAKGKAEEAKAELEKKFEASEARVKELEKKPAHPASIPAKRNLESEVAPAPPMVVGRNGEYTFAR